MEPRSQNAPVTSPGLHREFSVAQLKLIRRTVARTCTDAEFDEFVAVATQCGLDPMRRHITPMILNPDDPNKRRLIPWATIDGLRVIAARQGDYRPMEGSPLIEQEGSKVDPDTNPLGLVRAEVRAWKSSGNAWYPVVGEAWWDEYAPVRDEWEVGEGGRRAPTGRTLLEPAWRRMGRVMIAKCAEAQALRRGWPDVLSGLYGAEELHALRRAEQTASEVLRQSSEDALRRVLNTRTLWFVLRPGGALEPVALGGVFRRLAAYYDEARVKADIDWFDRVNRASLQTLWEWAPGDALALKQMSEARREILPSTERATAIAVGEATTGASAGGVGEVAHGER